MSVDTAKQSQASTQADTNMDCNVLGKQPHQFQDPNAEQRLYSPGSSSYYIQHTHELVGLESCDAGNEACV